MLTRGVEALGTEHWGRVENDEDIEFVSWLIG